MTIGLLLLAGLVTIFVDASQSQQALQRSAQQIENGRYATDVLIQDLHHAAYYGRYAAYPDGTTLPDPCMTGGATAILGALGYPIQGIVAPVSLTGTSCATYLPAANRYPGSDILVIRRAQTSALAVGATAMQNEVYLQSTPWAAEIQFGNGAAITSTSKADGSAADLFKKDGVTAAEIRKLHVHIYFVAPCSIPAGGGATCTGPNDDGGQPIPTLKRLELGVLAGVLTFSVAPVAEGIEALKVEYGIDNGPNVTNGYTGRIGDGVPDVYLPNAGTAQPGAADYPSAVTSRVFIIARDPQSIVGYTDTKTYPVATDTASGGTGLVYGPYNDQYKRHAYSTEIRLTNMSARRENP